MFEICSIHGVVSMADNIYGDVAVLTVGTLCSLYVLSFIAKKIEKSFLGDIFSMCGRESYYIMAFHLIGFKIGSIILSLVGISKPMDSLFSPANNMYE